MTRGMPIRFDPYVTGLTRKELDCLDVALAAMLKDLEATEYRERFVRGLLEKLRRNK